MSSWRENWVITIRGSQNPDRTADGYHQATLYLASARPLVLNIGTVEQDGDQRLLGTTELRLGMEIKGAITTVLFGVYEELQSQASTWELQRRVLPHTYLWVESLVADGSVDDPPSIPRARLISAEYSSLYTAPIETGDNAFWDNEYEFPWPCQRDGDLSITPKFDDGTEEWSLKLLARDSE